MIDEQLNWSFPVCNNNLFWDALSLRFGKKPQKYLFCKQCLQYNNFLTQDFPLHVRMNEETLYCGYIYGRMVILIDKIKGVWSLFATMNRNFYF